MSKLTLNFYHCQTHGLVKVRVAGSVLTMGLVASDCGPSHVVMSCLGHSVMPDLPSQSMSSTMGTCQVCGGGGVAPPSLVKVTWISKQYQILGWSDFNYLMPLSL